MNDNLEKIYDIISKHTRVVDTIETDSGDSLLHKAASDHNTLAASMLIGCNININHQNHEGDTALITASQEGNLMLVNMLLQQQQIRTELTNRSGMTALMTACEGGHTQVVNTLLNDDRTTMNSIDSQGHHCLNIAIRHRHMDTIYTLITHGMVTHTNEEQKTYIYQLYNAKGQDWLDEETRLQEIGDITRFSTREAAWRRRKNMTLFFYGLKYTSTIDNALMEWPAGARLRDISHITVLLHAISSYI